MTGRPEGQKGAQRHPEGGHGERTTAAIREQLQSRGRNAGEGNAQDPAGTEHANRSGRHRIREDRQQHDAADRNSEKNRRRREKD